MRKIDVILYLVTLLLLLVPYGIMVLSKKLEPYPAIILPDGSSTVLHDDEYITYSKVELLGRDTLNGDLQKINITAFLDPIPSNGIYGLMNNSFGINKVRNDTFFFRKEILPPLINSKYYSELEVKELSDWYKLKLSYQGLDNSEFIFQEEIITIDRVTNEIVDSLLSRSVKYTLYD